ncbi:MAG: YgiQ family radical SAM protein [Candidatus Omnitrophica bacterium]|nr:YgiQ family radical SAM protein [Candidatus Omnitrophota bacterium]MCG2704100.1 YgiQ family radical SAM protein [Candidatus Omnitrophota bacterium]
MNNTFLPISRKEMEQRGWDELDVILISGDAYVDHPSYGIAVIGRVLENAGYRVGIISQPDRGNIKSFQALGRPRLFFGITSGNIDSMIANYTANRKPRAVDDYSPGGKSGLRPDRALIVYTNKIREAFGKNIAIVIGGIEASLRRFSHYDYWDNSVRRSILLDSRANVLVYGMGEHAVLEIARRLNNGEKINALNDIRGTAVVREDISRLEDYALIPTYDETKNNAKKFNQAFRTIYANTNPFTAKTVVQEYFNRFLINFPPALPLRSEELDKVHELPYTRKWHPAYNAQGGIKGLETVRFSVISHRGCCGECSFCSLYFHQGRIVQSRSAKSILKELELIAGEKGFPGTITDIGGPTANLYQAHCPRWDKEGFCEKQHCLIPEKCKNLRLGYKTCLEVYKKAGQIPGVKHVFIGSGFRYDLLVDRDSREYFEEICKHHISGQMKVAPEHVADNVLKIMNKPSHNTFDRFVQKFNYLNSKFKKNQFLVSYFISSHPGSTLQDTLQIGLYLAKQRLSCEQIQDFLPSPMTLSTCIYHTQTHPFTGENIYSARSFREKKMQRALIQHKNPKNKKLVVEVLQEIGSVHLLKDLKTAHSPKNFHPGQTRGLPACGGRLRRRDKKTRRTRKK